MMINLDHLSDWPPKVSVVICTYKRPQSLLRVLSCLSEQKHTDFKDIEVVVANDGSHEDGYQDFYNGYPFPVNYLTFPRNSDGFPNLYHIKNEAVQATTFNEVIWLVDDDLVFDDHTLAFVRIYHHLLGDVRPVIVPHYAEPTELPEEYRFKNSYYLPPREDEIFFQEPFPFAPQPSDWDKLRVWVDFSGLSLWKNDWDRVGGIDLRYNGAMGFADLDLGMMLWEDGCQVMHVDCITCIKDDRETGSHRDRFLHVDGVQHRNGNLFMDKWGEETAAKYGVTK